VNDPQTRLVPKLRFPEFRGVEGWDCDALGHVAVFVNEKMPLERVALENYVSTENILADYGGVTRASKLPTTGSVTRYRPNDTLVSNIRPYLKKVWVADKEGGASNDVIVIRAKQRLHPQYFSYLLKNDAFIDYVMTSAKGVKMPRGDVGSMKVYPTLFPSKPEQQKIADCLGSLDELIAAQARKVEALKTHKKGLMQQLFPREGETQPRLRFSEFRDAGNWTPTNFGALGLDVSDGNYSSKYPNQSDFVTEGVPFLRANNLKFGTVSDDDMRFISKEQHSQLTKGHLKLGDILITTRGELGTVALVPDRHIGSNINAQIVRINSRNRLINTFLFQLLDHSREIGLFEVLSTGTALKQLPIGKLNQLSFLIPQKHEEQQRIADCLISLDSLINEATEELDAIKTHKKGLMQQLFPALDEASR
jgi:type I restriction enzyme, S subunit